MNACQQTQALLFEKADGRVDPTVRAELDAHLAICPHCQQVCAMWAGALPRLRGLVRPIYIAQGILPPVPEGVGSTAGMIPPSSHPGD